ncbi:OLC1v1024667C1 [Oldenlandia corymbosa var. corymbosa]|uniref:OLC1v1024667C1 n=1 Tax=Oldenlandia corymbosa var. corymbosa TaxID=529605 RepID=A0AAV1C5B5_OLDCO|nr:OLC1v1024667C1 [Oldenlandia corymbosa var. corymbosa]
MPKLPATTFPLVLIIVLVASISSTTNAHNITHILAGHPEFSTFNHYLTTTHLADEINRRRTITVCAVDNAGMSDLLAKHFPLPILKNVLSLHVFADYFGAKKIHQISKGSTTVSTLFQATGEAAGTAGYVKITDAKGGKVGFSVADYEGDYGPFSATFVKSLDEVSYDIAVLQISNVLSSPEAEAPVGAPADMNVTNLMEKQGCKAFADLLQSSGAEETFTQNAAGGITVFCPSDEAINGFMKSYKNLTNDGKQTLLLYHGIPFYNSLGMLKSKNGALNTLATEGKNKFDLTVKTDGEDLVVSTEVNSATLTGTLIDQDPLAVFKIDKVLLPHQLFKSVPGAPAPKASKGSKSKDASADAPGPAGDDDSVPADATASDNGSVRVSGGGIWLMSVVLSLVLGYCMV